jgi:hypothetical protein
VSKAEQSKLGPEMPLLVERCLLLACVQSTVTPGYFGGG